MATGTVKFFNPAKGFGFIASHDGSPDIFVHVSAVERAGLDGLHEGDEVAYEAQTDRRSGKLAAIDLQVTGPAPAARHDGSQAGSGGFERRQSRPSRAEGSGRAAGSGFGVVKWFNSQKGFGFIQTRDGGADVFVHVSAVERAGLHGLSDGQSLAYDLVEDRRTGKLSAVNLRLD